MKKALPPIDSVMMRPRFDEDRMNPKQAAAYLGLSPLTLDTDVTRKKLNLPYYKVGSRRFYRKSDLDVWLEKRRFEIAWG